MATATFVQNGNAIDYTPASDVAAGDVVVQGDLIGVAKVPIPAGTLGALAVEGVFDFPKGVGQIFAGDAAYWDEAAQRVVENPDNEANPLLGWVVRDAEADDFTVRVKLDRSPRSYDGGSSS